jgi:hypothetical protein
MIRGLVYAPFLKKIKETCVKSSLYLLCIPHAKDVQKVKYQVSAKE